MKKSLKLFENMLEVASDPNKRSEEKLACIASYITNDARQFAAEVASAIEAFETISSIAEKYSTSGRE